MMGNHSTTRSVNDLLDGTELNGRRIIKIMEKSEATFSSVVSEAAPSAGEKRKGAIPAVQSGNFNQNLLISSAYSVLV